MKVGFLGLGRMGSGMARCILDAGHDLGVFNRTRGKTAAYRDDGAVVAESIPSLCKDQDVVITMLTDDEALEAVALGDGGLVASLDGSTVHVAMGTHSIEFTRRLAAAHLEAGQSFVGAPVLGRPDRAAAGQLNIIAGGSDAALKQVVPIFEVMGQRVFAAGATPDKAAAVKIAHNFILGCAIEVMGEGTALVRKLGVDAGLLLEVLTEGLFAAPAYKIYGQMIVDQAYDNVGFTALTGLKDANLALSAAEQVQMPLPSCNVWRDRLLGAVAHGDGERDWAVVALEQARASGLE